MRGRKGWREEWRIPRMWQDALFHAQPVAKTWMLAFILLAEAENQFCPTYFKLPNKGLTEAGINRWAKWRSLQELKDLGLLLSKHTARRAYFP